MSILEALDEPLRIERNGKEYLISQMTLGDSAELERWAEERFWKDMQNRLKRADQPEEQKLIRHRMATITRAEIRTEANEFIRSPESNPKMIFFMLRRNHTDLKEDDCADLFSTAEFNEIYAKVYRLDEIDKITRMEQKLLQDIIPDLFRKFDDKSDQDISHPADFISQLRKAWAGYQKELEIIRPREV